MLRLYVGSDTGDKVFFVSSLAASNLQIPQGSLYRHIYVGNVCVEVSNGARTHLRSCLKWQIGQATSLYLCIESGITGYGVRKLLSVLPLLDK